MADTLVVEGVEVKADDTPVGLQFPKDPGAKDREALAGSRKPPADGPCKGCGQEKPLNRLMLCYRCWVIKNLQDEAKSRGEDFLPGIDPHPSWCKCTLPEHGGRTAGN